MWPNSENTDRLLADAGTGTPAAVDALLGEFREHFLGHDEFLFPCLLQDSNQPLLPCFPPVS